MPPLIDCDAGVTLERAVPCRMSDGVTLIADHYHPPHSANHSHPTLLMRQPYGRDIASTIVYAHPVWFARHGYNVVIQDVRGRGGSEGDFYPFRHEARDGAETIAALIQRPESNGRVGMYGFSYQGITQLLAAAEQPPGLVCIAPAQTAHDLYHGWFYANGALRLASTLGWGLQLLKADARRIRLHEASDLLERAWASPPAQYLETPYAAHPALKSPPLPTYVQDWLEHDAPSGYWSSMDISQRLADIRTPALHLSGWYDTYLTGSIDCFQALRAHAGTAHARDHQYLIAGPWVHIPWGDRIGAHYLGPEANLDTDALLLRWFNHWLKDTNEFAAEPRIRHFALDFNTNNSQWHSADEWPTTPNHTLYLHSQGRANSSKGDGTLTHSPPTAQEPPDLFIYDPEVPVSAPGGLASISGPTNQAALELGNNLLIYTAAPLDHPTHIFGTPLIELHCATSAAYADLTAKLICLRPTGEAIFLSLGIARSAHLFPNYAPDTSHHWRFSLAPTSCIFAPGDRIRIEVASSAFPLFDRNPSTPTPPRLADSWTWQRSTQTILHDPTRPSCLRLHILTPHATEAP
ncbi:MAG: CocE/NonD family hydrolase [Acidobacteriaceae bacterium]|jgi:putative CocE/NonD family hydrolase